MLFLDDQPTADQYIVFHKDYNTMLNTISSCSQRARQALCEEIHRGGAESARRAIRKVIREVEESPLTELLDRASRLGNSWKPTCESDPTSGFILRMLEPLFNRLDAIRLAQF